MWDGETVAILASGPSMNRDVPRMLPACVRTIAINRTIELAPDADMFFAADWTVWKGSAELPALKATLARFKGMKVAVFAGGNKARASQMPPDDVFMLKHTGTSGFDDDPSCIRTGENSGYMAMHIAAHAGARRLLLFGFDMRPGHWHGRYPKGFYNTAAEQYGRWIKLFATLAPELAKRGVEVFNCTPGSALEVFPFLALDDFKAAA